jgi:hypothetical protein
MSSRCCAPYSAALSHSSCGLTGASVPVFGGALQWYFLVPSLHCLGDQPYIILVPGGKNRSVSRVMSNHLSTSVVSASLSHCPYCEKKLPLIQRLFGSEFCSRSHRSAHASQQQEMFLARLYMGDGFVADRPTPSPPLCTSPVVTEKIEPPDFSCFIKC